MAELHVFAGPGGRRLRVPIRAITVADVLDALRLGVDDFMAKPSHYLLISLIYPVVGLALFVRVSEGNALQLIYPLVAGFALIGPLAALGLYEISRRRELGLDASWAHAFAVVRSPALPAIAAVAVLLLVLFAGWLASAQALYVWLYGPDRPAALAAFLADVIATRRGWTLILIGNLVGAGFALVALATTVIAFPLLLDRDVGARAAVRTSLHATLVNPKAVLAWGMIVAAGLVLGSLPFLVGLAVVLPVLGHATWHLYRKIVVGEPVAQSIQSKKAKRVR